MKRWLYIIGLLPSLAFAGGQLSFHSFGGDQVVGLYHLNENGETTARDSSGNENTGTLDTCVWVSGQMGSAITCSGNGKEINLSNETKFDFLATTAFYVVVRAKSQPGGVSGPVVVGKHNLLNTNPGWRLLQQVGALNDLEWKVTAGGASCRWTTGNLTLTNNNFFDGRWHTLIMWWDGTNACTYDATARKSGGGGLYIDGIQPVVTLTGTSITGDPLNDQPPSIAGSNQASTDFTNGTIDEVAFVRGVMTPEKAQRIHALFNTADSDDDN